LHYGYAVFEGMRSYKIGNRVKIFKAKEHFQRMEYSCRAVHIPYPFNNDELIDICYNVLEKNNLSDAYIRPLVSCSPNMTLIKAREAQLLIAAWDWGAYFGDHLLNVVTSPFKRPSSSAFIVDAKVSGHYVNSILACQHARDKGYDEALLLDEHGFVAEGPGANIFIENDGVLYTPQLGNILPGITRGTILEMCERLDIPVVEKQITLDEVHGADSAFFCGTAAEVIGIAFLDDIPFKKQWNETLGIQIQRAYKNLVLEKDYISLSLLA
jgi:branched-chain amino acid aminotransferase